ncbi:hypothetical protein BGZ63DRAFT_171368 [Mariannaea sp. PMI_226]|nr:hypothetical protein BGZ63DRAFT_171368 [Mariannaea sp. PMI_226]
MFRYLLRLANNIISKHTDDLSKQQASVSNILKTVICYLTQSIAPRLEPVWERNVDHSIDDDMELSINSDESKENLKCPELGCPYQAVESYQALQRHYLTHLPCNVKCSFCRRRLRKVSQACTHYKACRQRLDQLVPATEHQMIRDLANDGYRKLESELAERRQLSRGANGIALQRALTLSITDGTFILSLDQREHITDGMSVLPPGDLERAPMLSTHTADGTLMPSLDQLPTEEEQAPNNNYITNGISILPPGDLERAPMLSKYTADGTFKPSHDQPTGDRERAPMLSTHTADGTFIRSYKPPPIEQEQAPIDTYNTDGMSMLLPADLERAPMLSKYTADGTFIS